VPSAVKDLILLLASASLSLTGWWVAHNPARVFHVFNLGMQPERPFYLGFFRFWGWLYVVLGAAGTVLFLVEMNIDLFR
jgi:hypothetical protein